MFTLLFMASKGSFDFSFVGVLFNRLITSVPRSFILFLLMAVM